MLFRCPCASPRGTPRPRSWRPQARATPPQFSPQKGVIPTEAESLAARVDGISELL